MFLLFLKTHPVSINYNAIAESWRKPLISHLPQNHDANPMLQPTTKAKSPPPAPSPSA